MVLSFIDFKEWGEWVKAMDAPEIKLPKEQTIGNTEKWLLDSVIPALARVIFLSPTGDFYEKFTLALTDKLAELSNKRQTVH